MAYHGISDVSVRHPNARHIKDGSKRNISPQHVHSLYPPFGGAGMILSFMDIDRNLYGNRVLEMIECRQQVELMIRLLHKSEDEKQIR